MQKEVRKNRVRKRRVVGRIYGIKYSRKGHKDRNRHRNRIRGSGEDRNRYKNRIRSGQARIVFVKNIKP